MLYREAGQFKASYAEDQQIFALADFGVGPPLDGFPRR